MHDGFRTTQGCGEAFFNIVGVLVRVGHGPVAGDLHDNVDQTLAPVRSGAKRRECHTIIFGVVVQELLRRCNLFLWQGLRKQTLDGLAQKLVAGVEDVGTNQDGHNRVEYLPSSHPHQGHADDDACGRHAPALRPHPG